MNNTLLLLTFGFFMFLISSCKDSGRKNLIHQTANEEKSQWRLVWQDEFDGEGLPEQSKWNFVTGDGCPNLCGWGNNEEQFYVRESLKNTRLEDGKLIIEAHQEKIAQSSYSSGKLVSKERQSWLYGKLEIKAKLPSGKGTWPAIWMMPDDSYYGRWPKSGEIDIMEHVGFSPDTIFGTVHSESYNHLIGTHEAKGVYVPDAESTFHTYSIEWDKEKIEWLIDDKVYHSFENQNKSYKEWPFDKPFYLILNLAVGGDWGGKHGVDQNIWPQKLIVDYVRVYQLEGGL